MTIAPKREGEIASVTNHQAIPDPNIPSEQELRLGNPILTTDMSQLHRVSSNTLHDSLR